MTPWLPHEDVARFEASRFFWPGADREDVEQEARFALLRARPSCRAHARVVVRSHLIEQVRRETRRRPRLVRLVDAESPDEVLDKVEARERLRTVLSAPLSELERVALGRAMRGETCPKGSLDNALQRAKRKLAA